MRTSVMTMALAAVSWGIPLCASAQERTPAQIEVAAGWLGFPDDALVGETFVGGAARFYVSPRVSLGPELAFVNGQSHSHLILTGNLMFDVLPPNGARAPRATPFVVVGGGLFNTRQQFPTGGYSSSEGAFTAGGGLRVRVSDRVSAGVEARIGWELHVRINGVIGVAIGR